MRSKKTDVERFWARVEQGPDCWHWRGHSTPGRMPQLKWGGRFKSVYRIAWIIRYGTEPRADIIHSCDTRLCVNPNHLIDATPDVRFWRQVNITDGCWEWTGTIDSVGYGRFSVDGRQYKAHRYALEQSIGSLPGHIFACHKCDNRRCVRPDHLFSGTNSDNIQDAVAKGRACFGERHHSTKLKAVDIPVIRARLAKGETPWSISKDYGVWSNTIKSIATGRSWKSA